MGTISHLDEDRHKIQRCLERIEALEARIAELEREAQRHVVVTGLPLESQPKAACCNLADAVATKEVPAG